jgi:hypothetical protein
MLYRQYAIKYLSLAEIKSLLGYFGCDLKDTISLGCFIRKLNVNSSEIDEITNKNIQMLKSLHFTNPYLLNKKLCSIKWNQTI